MKTLREKSFKKGEIIYRQGDCEAWLYDILYGSVALYQNYGTREEILVTEIGPEGYFGEIELIEACPRTTTAVALERTRAYVVTAEDLSACFTERPALVLSIMQQMSERIRALTRSYNDACRVVAEAMEAERAGREKSSALQRERRRLSDFYHSYLKMLGG